MSTMLPLEWLCSRVIAPLLTFTPSTCHVATGHGVRGGGPVELLGSPFGMSTQGVLQAHRANVDATHRLRDLLRAHMRKGGDEELPIGKEGVVQLVIAPATSP